MSPSCRAGKEEVGELLSTACSLLSFALPLLLFLALSVFPSSLGLFLRLSLSLPLSFYLPFPPLYLSRSFALSPFNGDRQMTISQTSLLFSSCSSSCTNLCELKYQKLQVIITSQDNSYGRYARVSSPVQARRSAVASERVVVSRCQDGTIEVGWHWRQITLVQKQLFAILANSIFIRVAVNRCSALNAKYV